MRPVLHFTTSEAQTTLERALTLLDRVEKAIEHAPISELDPAFEGAVNAAWAFLRNLGLRASDPTRCILCGGDLDEGAPKEAAGFGTMTENFKHPTCP